VVPVVGVVPIQAGKTAAHSEDFTDRGSVGVEEGELRWEMVGCEVVETDLALVDEAHELGGDHRLCRAVCGMTGVGCDRNTVPRARRTAPRTAVGNDDRGGDTP
jgi:hypothetical protein